ncbi:MAG: GatB/YqeY domain-containing protein [Aerococcus sp.]|nr:GatB/YqeY domain-containing protein [Aerococcus sp.]
MAILERINVDMKQAMKAKDKKRLSVIRMLKGALQKEAIDHNGELTEEQELQVIARELKQRKDSVQEFQAAGREDLATDTEAEIAIVEEYLPEQLSEADIEKKVKAVIEQVGATSMKDFGKVMGQAVSAMKGQADGNQIQQIAKKLLNQ